MSAPSNIAMNTMMGGTAATPEVPTGQDVATHTELGTDFEALSRRSSTSSMPSPFTGAGGTGGGPQDAAPAQEPQAVTSGAAPATTPPPGDTAPSQSGSSGASGAQPPSPMTQPGGPQLSPSLRPPVQRLRAQTEPGSTLQVPAQNRSPRLSLEGNPLPDRSSGTSSIVAQGQPTGPLSQRRVSPEGSSGGQSHTHSQRFQSNVPLDNPSGPKHYGVVNEGNHLLFKNTENYSHIQSNNGEVTSTNNRATVKVDGNNNKLNLENNQGKVLVDTNYATMHNQRNAGNMEVGTNGGSLSSVGTPAGGRESVTSNVGHMTIDGSRGSHFVGRNTDHISLGSPAKAAVPAGPDTPATSAVPSNAGLLGKGTMQIDAHKNGSVTQHFDAGTNMHYWHQDGITHRPDGKPLTLTSSGKPGFFSPVATHKAGKKWETYGPRPYHAVGAGGIYAANVAGTPSSIANMVKTFSSLGHPASATSSAATTAPSTTSAGGVPSSTRAAAAHVDWANPPGSVPTMQTHPPSSDLTLDSAGVPQINPHPTSSSATRPYVDVTVPGSIPAVNQPQSTSDINGDSTLKTITKPKGP